MLLLAHIGYTTGAVRILDKFALRRRLDYRLVVILASPHACDYDSATMEPPIQYTQTADGVSIVFCTMGSSRVIRRILLSPQRGSLYHRHASPFGRPGGNL